MTTLGGERMTTLEEAKRPWFQYKDLVIGFTTDFEFKWNQVKTGGKYAGSYWRPIVPSDMTDFHPVGDLGYSHVRFGINEEKTIVVVKDAKDPTTDPALCPPESFERVWTAEGSGAKYKGSMWRPVPPEEYVALGLVCNDSYSDEPSRDCVRCVRSDLVVPARAGDMIWSSQGTGKQTAFGSWGIDAPGAPPGEVYLSPGTFIGWTHLAPPGSDPNAYALRLKIEQEPPTSQPPSPVLNGFSRPSPFEEGTELSWSTLPWFAVRDPNLTPAEQMVQSPKYKLERSDRYILLDYGYNTTSETQEYSLSTTVGTSGSNQKTFSSTTSVELGCEWQCDGVFKVSAKLSQSFTHSVASARGWSQAETRTITTNIAPGTAVATYAIQSTYRLIRKDGSQISTDVPYNVENVYWTQYPPARKDQVKA